MDLRPVRTFTQSALFEAIRQYQRSESELLAEANASIVKWKIASEDMYGLFPLFDQIGFHVDDDWRPTQRRWLTNDPDGFAYHPGFDVEGKVRIIKEEKGWTRLFTYVCDSPGLSDTGGSQIMVPTGGSKDEPDEG